MALTGSVAEDLYSHLPHPTYSWAPFSTRWFTMKRKLIIQGQAANRDEETFAGNLYPNVYS